MITITSYFFSLGNEQRWCYFFQWVTRNGTALLFKNNLPNPAYYYIVKLCSLYMRPTIYTRRKIWTPKEERIAFCYLTAVILIKLINDYYIKISTWYLFFFYNTVIENAKTHILKLIDNLIVSHSRKNRNRK